MVAAKRAKSDFLSTDFVLSLYRSVTRSLPPSLLPKSLSKYTLVEVQRIEHNPDLIF